MDSGRQHSSLKSPATGAQHSPAPRSSQVKSVSHSKLPGLNDRACYPDGSRSRDYTSKYTTDWQCLHYRAVPMQGLSSDSLHPIHVLVRQWTAVRWFERQFAVCVPYTSTCRVVTHVTARTGTPGTGGAVHLCFHSRSPSNRKAYLPCPF